MTNVFYFALQLILEALLVGVSLYSSSMMNGLSGSLSDLKSEESDLKWRYINLQL